MDVLLDFLSSIVANNREELPFNRIERGWIYASAKKENNYEGFGTSDG